MRRLSSALLLLPIVVVIVPGCGGEPIAAPTCADTPCPEPDTVCVERADGPSCECREGTLRVGDACVAPETCTDATCHGHGTCSIDAGAVSCACDPDFAGPLCERCADGLHDDGMGGCTGDPCTPSPCGSDRECRVEMGAAVCACPPGQHDEGGACVADTTCLPTTCGGHGTCAASDGMLTCACEAGWSGTFCGACDVAAGWHDDGAGGCTMDPCTPSPCTEAHRGVCTAQSDGSASCDCDAGYHLELDVCVVDETCEASTCSGHGACEVVAGLTRCTCDAGSTGDACDACDVGYHDDGADGCTMDPCLPDPCTAIAHRTVCTASGATATCACEGGWHDDGVGGCTMDPCTPSPCAAMGMACRDVGGTAECYTPVCDDGNPCTDDTVVAGACVYAARPDGSSCSTSLCVQGEMCSAGTCGGGAAVSCDDGNPCTADACDAIAGCSHASDDSLVPDDGVACTTDACSAGVATHVASDAACDDARWCTGVEACMPGDARADARGCVARDVPVPPALETTCGRYVCSDGSMRFDLVATSAGTGCDDRIACTTGDACDGTGACRGTVTAACGSIATCTGAPFSGSIELAPARVTGRLLYAGSTSFPGAAQSSGIGIYLRSHDTGVLHRIESVSFNGTASGGVYPVASYGPNDDRVLDLPVLPGIYDVVYRRWSYGSTDGDQIWSHYPTDAYAHANQVLQRDVVIGPGTNALDIDIAPARVTGSLRYAGSTTFPGAAESSGIGIYLRSHDTGVLHRLESVSFNGTASGGVYPVASYGTNDDRVLDLPVLPGTYDVVYRRWSYASTDGGQIWSHYPTDAYAHANQVLQRDVVIGPGTNTLTIDVAPGRIAGSLRYAGSTTFPGAAQSTGIGIYLRSHETGVLHRIESVSFNGTASGGVYPVASYGANDDRNLDLPVLPGTYDVVYRRWSYASTDGDQIWSHYPSDAYAHANQVLQRDVVIGASGTTTLTIDVAPVRIAGTLRYGGSTTFPGAAQSTGIGIYLRSHETGVLHRIESVSFSGTASGGVYPVASYGANDDRTLDLPVLPGTYDVVYRRWSYASTDGDQIWSHYPTDAYAHANQVLQRDVVIGASGTTTLTIDVAPVRIAGTLRYGGSTTFPGAAQSTGIGIYLRSHDTGVLHRIESVSFNGTASGGVYPVASYGANDDRTLDLPVLPGTYDVVYRRWSYASTDGDQIWSHYPTDAYAHANQVLQRDVVIGASGTTSLAIEVSPARISGALRYGGATTFPGAAQSTGIGVYLRSHETGVLHRIESVSFNGTASGGVYPVASYGPNDDRVLDLPLLPGTYDVVYRRWSYASTDGDQIWSHYPTDAYAHANQWLQACVEISR